MRLTTARLVLRSWEGHDRESFARLNADPEVMADLGGPLSRRESDEKFDRFTACEQSAGFTRWVVERCDGDGDGFVGYAGGKAVPVGHPLGAHVDIGWRLCREAWGHGFATEAASAALDDLFGRAGVAEVYAYTSADNLRSQRVMERLGLERLSDRDFVVPDAKLGEWFGLVWIARPPRTQAAVRR